MSYSWWPLKRALHLNKILKKTAGKDQETFHDGQLWHEVALILSFKWVKNQLKVLDHQTKQEKNPHEASRCIISSVLVLSVVPAEGATGQHVLS